MYFDTIRGHGGLKPFEYTTLRVQNVKFLKKIVKTTNINWILCYKLVFGG